MMSDIDKYLKEMDDSSRKALEHIRAIVREMVPEAEEAISYGMPGFKYKGKYLLGFAAFRDHLSFFPTSYPIEKFEDRLGEFKTSKGTIQFTALNPIPDSLLREIIQFRLDTLS